MNYFEVWSIKPCGAFLILVGLVFGLLGGALLLWPPVPLDATVDDMSRLGRAAIFGLLPYAFLSTAIFLGVAGLAATERDKRKLLGD